MARNFGDTSPRNELLLLGRHIFFPLVGLSLRWVAEGKKLHSFHRHLRHRNLNRVSSRNMLTYGGGWTEIIKKLLLNGFAEKNLLLAEWITALK